MIVLIFLNSVFMHVNMCTYTKHTHKHEVNVCVCEKEREMRVCYLIAFWLFFGTDRFRPLT